MAVYAPPHRRDRRPAGASMAQSSHEEVEVAVNPTCRHNPRLAGSTRTALLCAALALPGMVAAAAMPSAVQRVELVRADAGSLQSGDA